MVSVGLKVRDSWAIVPGIAATYIGTVIGAGFASGREIYQFFTRWGVWGNLGLALAVLLMGAAGVKIFQIGRTIRAQSYRDLLAFLLGRRLAAAADLLLSIFFLILIGVMFAGSGAIFAELGLGYWAGIALSALLLLWVLYHELPGLITANLLIVPLMFGGLLAVAWFTLTSRGALHLPAGEGLNWVIAAIQFSSYNLVLSIPVLLSLSRRYPFAASLKAGGWLGSIGLGVMAALIHWSILMRLPALEQCALPMLQLAKAGGYWLYFGYALVLWAEMLSTLFANAFGLAERLAAGTGWPFRFWVLLLTAAGITTANAGFTNLIARFYPLYGFICLMILVLIMGGGKLRKPR